MESLVQSVRDDPKSAVRFPAPLSSGPSSDSEWSETFISGSLATPLLVDVRGLPCCPGGNEAGGVRPTA